VEIADGARNTALPMRASVTPCVSRSDESRNKEDRVLIIGPDRSGQLLEVVVLDPEDDPIAIHAMRLRRKFFDYL
jgi:hypothetical protein